MFFLNPTVQSFFFQRETNEKRPYFALSPKFELCRVFSRFVYTSAPISVFVVRLFRAEVYTFVVLTQPRSSSLLKGILVGAPVEAYVQGSVFVHIEARA